MPLIISHKGKCLLIFLVPITNDISKLTNYQKDLYQQFLSIGSSISDILKEFDIKVYDKNTKVWEFNLNSLQELIDKLSAIDDIKLKFQKDPPEIDLNSIILKFTPLYKKTSFKELIFIILFDYADLLQ